MSSLIPMDVLCLHVAGGTADECVKLVRAFGSPGPWRERSPDEWHEAGLPDDRSRLVLSDPAGRAAQAEAAACAERGIRLVWCEEDDFPPALRALPQAPLVLAVRGRWPPPEPALGVVGSRAATPYGMNATRRLAGAAARAGVALVSGLARGIDRAAHDAALAEGACPIAVLGNGLGIPYPPEHAGLQETIAREGTLISEFTLHDPPTRWTFPRRNRLIAALARWLLVVEASSQSGALITARHAIELNRPVLVVPGPIDSATSQGTNRLIADGAQPILDVEDLLLALDLTPAAGTQGSRHPLLVAMGSAVLPPDEIARRLMRPVSEVRAALVALELQGRVVRVAGGRYAAR
jgi:DNA processing protein